MRDPLGEPEAATARLLHAILEAANSHLAYLDRELRFVMVNSLYERGCGHSREELIGRNHFDLFPSEENKAIFTRVRDTGEAVEYREKPFEYADQPERGVTYWDWTLTPIKDGQGRVEGLVLSLTDVTEGVRQRERLLEAERARAALAETLSAEIQHRVKNDLAMVAAILEMRLAALRPRSRARSAIEEAIARIHTLAQIHDHLHRVPGEEVALCGALRRVAEASRAALGREDVVIRATCGAGELLCRAPAVTHLGIVVNELVVNAMKHGAPGRGGRQEIELSCRRDGERLTISVWNSGNPVAAGFAPPERQGSGLALVREILAMQYEGSVALRPHRGGTLAEVTVRSRRLLSASDRGRAA